MRSLLTLAVIMSFVITDYSIAQKVINDAMLRYDVGMQSSANPRQFENTSLKIFLKGKQSRSEVTSSLGTEISIFDANTEKGAIIKEYSGQKLLILLTRENWNARNNQFRQLSFKETGEVKKINSYECNKAVAVLPGGNELTVYYAPEYFISNSEYSFAFPAIKGLPVEFELTSKDVTFTYQLKELNVESAAVTNKLFELPKSGNYRTMSYEEATQLKKKDN